MALFRLHAHHTAYRALHTLHTTPHTCTRCHTPAHARVYDTDAPSRAARCLMPHSACLLSYRRATPHAAPRHLFHLHSAFHTRACLSTASHIAPAAIERIAYRASANSACYRCRAYCASARTYLSLARTHTPALGIAHYATRWRLTETRQGRYSLYACLSHHLATAIPTHCLLCTAHTISTILSSSLS